jgi:acyl-CoA-binding protein
MPAEEFKIFVPGYEQFTKIVIEKNESGSNINIYLWGKLNPAVYNSLLNTKRANRNFMNSIGRERQLYTMALRLPARGDPDSGDLIGHIKTAIRTGASFRPTIATNAPVTADDQAELQRVFTILETHPEQVAYVPQIASILSKNISISPSNGTILRQNRYNQFFKANAKNTTIKRTQATVGQQNPFYTLSTGLSENFFTLVTPYLIKPVAEGGLGLTLLLGDPNNRNLEAMYIRWGMKPINNVIRFPAWMVGRDVYWGAPAPAELGGGPAPSGRITYMFGKAREDDDTIFDLIFNKGTTNEEKKTLSNSLKLSLEPAPPTPSMNETPQEAYNRTLRLLNKQANLRRAVTSNQKRKMINSNVSYLRAQLNALAREPGVVTAAAAAALAARPPNTPANNTFRRIGNTFRAGVPQTNADKLRLYGLYKQGIEGNATGPQPGMFNVAGRAKRAAWNTRKGMRKNNARAEYVRIARELGLL